MGDSNEIRVSVEQTYDTIAPAAESFEGFSVADGPNSDVRGTAL